VSASKSLVVFALCVGCATLRSPADSPTDGEKISDYDVIPFAGGSLEVRLATDKYTVAEWITNHYAIPVAIEIEHTTKNLRDSGAPIRSTVLPAHTPLRVAVWSIEDTDARWNEQNQIQAQLGDPHASPAPYVYGLPFSSGEAHRVIQGFNGTFSHTADEVFAVDFDMSEGTIVRAARDGIVVAYNDQAASHGMTTEFRDRSHANWVMVLHTDGTLGEYWHLKPHGVQVAIGQHVARGDVLGESGFTGFASGPHLHFVVRTAINGLHTRSFWFAIQSKPEDRIGAAPVAGQTYRAFE
jgi:murein DD-endopeptidase MepM/ murein hydrolase activator NlpD